MQGQIKHILLVASGKGGVGKSTLATNLAVALLQQNLRVGLLDADIYGPSLPTMLGAVDRPQAADGTDSNKITPVEKFGLQLMSMGYLVQRDTAMIWRGPMLAGAATQLLSDVAWHSLDVLVVDLPPGTGDIQLTLTQKFQVAGSILCTTPQDVALDDVIRAKTMFDKLRVPTLGLVENMSYFICHQCTTRHDIFATDGGAKLAKALNLPLLGRIPLETAVRSAGDQGIPVVLQTPESAAAKAFVAVAEQVKAILAQLGTPKPALRIRGRRSLPIVST